MSISPKRANSTPRDAVWAPRHEERRDRPDLVARMTREYRYQLKYVIDRPGDVDDVDRHVRGIGGIVPVACLLDAAGDRRRRASPKDELAAARGRGARLLRLAPPAHRTLRKPAGHVRRLIEAAEIQAKVAQLGRQITDDYRGRPLTVIGVLTGSVILVSDLIRSIDLPLRVGMIQASSYRGKATVPDKIVARRFAAARHPRPQRRSSSTTFSTRAAHSPRSSSTCARPSRAAFAARSCFGKSDAAKPDWEPDYFGFKIPDVFVVGYGLDYNDEHRSLPYVAALEEGDF